MSGAGALRKPLVVAIFGPTASGKTAVAEELADRIGGELVSADAMQMYDGLPVLTNQSERVGPVDSQTTIANFEVLRNGPGRS